jgi:hypothetical protein
MFATLTLRIKERYMSKRVEGLTQQISADAVGISVRSAQSIDREGRPLQGDELAFGRPRVVANNKGSECGSELAWLRTARQPRKLAAKTRGMINLT